MKLNGEGLEDRKAGRQEDKKTRRQEDRKTGRQEGRKTRQWKIGV